MAAHDRHAEHLGSGAHALQHRHGIGLAIGPYRIHDGNRTSPHGRDIGEIDHYPAPTGKPGVGGDKLVHEAFNGKQQVAVAIRYGRAIIAHRNGLLGQPQSPGDGPDILLGRDIAALAEAVGKGGQGFHQAALLGSATRPTSGVAMGG